MARIVLYSELGQQGRAVEFYTAVARLDDVSFNDAARSYRVVSGSWSVFADWNFVSRLGTIITAGQQGNFEGPGRPSSLRPLPEEGIALFAGEKTEGLMVFTTSDCADLGPSGVVPRSAYIPQGSWTLYEGPNFGGTYPWTVQASSSGQTIGDDRKIVSVKRAA